MTVPTSFPWHRPGSALTFPRDEGWHRLLPLQVTNPSLDHMEWAYLNAHVDEVGGQHRRFVVFAAYFTQHLRFLVVRAWDAAGRRVGTWTGSAWGLLRAAPDKLDLRFTHLGGTDTWAPLKQPDGSVRPFCSRLVARDDAARFAVELELVTTKAPYEVGGIGHLPFGSRGSFDYYSLTRLDAEGQLNLAGPSGAIESVHVKGLGWFDHQWGPFFVTPFRLPLLEQYEWMSIQLDSKDELMLTTVWDGFNHTPSLEPFGGAGWIRADGSNDRIVDAHLWKRKGFWRSPSQGFVYSSGWTFEAPQWGASLTITPRQLDQLTPIVDPPLPGVLGTMLTPLLGGAPNALGEFWEGSCDVKGQLDGRYVEGVAFAELIKRYDDPLLELELVRAQAGLTVVGWRVMNPDPQVPLETRAYLERPDGTVVRTWPTLGLPVLVLDDGALPRNTPLLVRVVVESQDGTLKGVATLNVTLS